MMDDNDLKYRKKPVVIEAFQMTPERAKKLLAHYNLPTDCDCDDDDCVRCSHYPTLQENAAKELKAAAPDLAQAYITSESALAGERAARIMAEAKVERLRDALEQIAQWSEAYPAEAFPEPDFARAAAALSAVSMSLDVVSASNMRHATKGVGVIARAALQETAP